MDAQVRAAVEKGLVDLLREDALAYDDGVELGEPVARGLVGRDLRLGEWSEHAGDGVDLHERKGAASRR